MTAVIVACASLRPVNSVETRAVMWFDQYDEVFTGVAVRSGPILGGGVLDLVNDRRDIRCVGRSEVRIVPPSVRPMDNCDGLSGVVTLSCSDGRSVELEYHVEEGCRTGYGEGADHRGHVVRAAFGGSEQHAATMAREARAHLKGSPRLPFLCRLQSAGIRRDSSRPPVVLRTDAARPRKPAADLLRRS